MAVIMQLLSGQWFIEGTNLKSMTQAFMNLFALHSQLLSAAGLHCTCTSIRTIHRIAASTQAFKGAPRGTLSLTAGLLGD